MMSKKGLTMDTFGEIVNRFITDAHITMMIEMPEGTQEPKITCTGVSAIDFYVLMAAIRPVFVALVKDMGGTEGLDAEGAIDDLWGIIREDILKQLEGL
jgi:hypothetical protein